jgi:hypothetical protein
MTLAQAVFWLPPEGASRLLALTSIADLRHPKSAPVLAGSLVAGTAREDLWVDEVYDLEHAVRVEAAAALERIGTIALVHHLSADGWPLPVRTAQPRREAWPLKRGRPRLALNRPAATRSRPSAAARATPPST